MELTLQSGRVSLNPKMSRGFEAYYSRMKELKGSKRECENRNRNSNRYEEEKRYKSPEVERREKERERKR